MQWVHARVHAAQLTATQHVTNVMHPTCQNGRMNALTNVVIMHGSWSIFRRYYETPMPVVLTWATHKHILASIKSFSPIVAEQGL